MTQHQICGTTDELNTMLYSWLRRCLMSINQMSVKFTMCEEDKLNKLSSLCLHKVRPGRVGTCDLYEDGGSEESGDGVRTEGLHRSRDLPDAGGGGHLQGPGEQHTTITPQH